MAPVSLTRRSFIASLAAFPVAGSLKAAAPAEEEIVDSHVHVWVHDPRYPWAPETLHPPQRDASAETLLSHMDSTGVSRTVIIQVIHYRWDNRYVADVIRRFPDKFCGVARVNPQDPGSPDTLSGLVENDHFQGVRLSPAGDASGDWIGGPLMAPLWQRCGQLRIPMTLLTPVSRLGSVARWVDRFPEVAVVIDHMADSPLGSPAALSPLLALARYPRVYVKVSHTWSLSRQAYPYTDAHVQIRRLYDAFGPRRLMAGTDWPLVEAYCSYPQAIDIVRNRVSFLSAEDRRWVCGATAKTLWRWS